MMPWSLLLSPTVLLGIALAAASAFGWLQTTRLGAAQDRIVATQARFDTFKAQVAAEGKIAQQKADTQAKADKLKKEQADASHKAAIALLSQRISSLRYDREHSHSYDLPAATPGSSRADVACFDRAEFGRASGEALGRLRAIADQGDAATLDLNTAKEWAK